MKKYKNKIKTRWKLDENKKNKKIRKEKKKRRKKEKEEKRKEKKKKKKEEKRSKFEKQVEAQVHSIQLKVFKLHWCTVLYIIYIDALWYKACCSFSLQWKMFNDTAVPCVAELHNKYIVHWTPIFLVK